MVNSLFTANNLYQQSFSLQGSSPAQLALGPVFPALLTASPAAGAGAANIGFAAPNLRTPYSQQANFSIQRQLDKSTSITLSYLWSNASQLLSARDLNLRDPSHTVTYNIQDASGASVGTYSSPVYLDSDRINRNYTRVNQVENGSKSNYNALAIQIQRRLSHGLEGELSYTWSHAIDTNLGGAGSNLFFGGNGPSTLFNGNYAADRADGSLDQRHRLVINWVYSPVFSHGSGVISRFLVNNWQLADITTISTGQPATATVSVTNALSAAQLTQAGLPGSLAYTGGGGSLNGFGGSSRVPYLAPNTLRLPNSYRTDVRLSKVLPFTERFRTTLNFEVFNLTNTVTFTSLNGRQYNLNGFNLQPANGFGQYTASSGFPDGTNVRRAQASIRIEF